MHVLPQSALSASRHDPLLQSLFISHIGCFPKARAHYRERPDGAEEPVLIICMSGAGWFRAEGYAGRLGSGQTLLLPRGAPHVYGADSSDPWSIYWVHFDGHDADHYVRHVTDTHRPCVIKVSREMAQRLEMHFRDIFQRFRRGYAPRALLMAAHILREGLGRLFFDNPKFVPGRHRRVRSELESVVDFMVQSPSAMHSLSDLARRASLSVPHFSVLFRRQYGRSPMGYLTHLRIRESCRLLDSTDYRIKEIAPRVGFSDPLHFSRVFRRVMGCSPRQYRQAFGGGE